MVLLSLLAHPTPTRRATKMGAGVRCTASGLSNRGPTNPWCSWNVGAAGTHKVEGAEKFLTRTTAAAAAADAATCGGTASATYGLFRSTQETRRCTTAAATRRKRAAHKTDRVAIRRWARCMPAAGALCSMACPKGGSRRHPPLPAPDCSLALSSRTPPPPRHCSWQCSFLSPRDPCTNHTQSLRSHCTPQYGLAPQLHSYSPDSSTPSTLCAATHCMVRRQQGELGEGVHSSRRPVGATLEAHWPAGNAAAAQRRAGVCARGSSSGGARRAQACTQACTLAPLPLPGHCAIVSTAACSRRILRCHSLPTLFSSRARGTLSAGAQEGWSSGGRSAAACAADCPVRLTGLSRQQKRQPPLVRVKPAAALPPPLVPLRASLMPLQGRPCVGGWWSCT